MDCFELDTLDRKIINALNLDVRATYSEIARSISSSKEVVMYRIKRLEKAGVIRGYVTIFGFGNWSYKILLNLNALSNQDENHMLVYLQNNPNVNWLTTCCGAYDLVFAVIAKNAKDFDKKFREILTNISECVLDYRIATGVGSFFYGHKYVFGDIKEPRRVKNVFLDSLDFDNKDRQIAKILHTDARSRLSLISRKTGIPIDTIRYRIKKMEKSFIIRRYRLILDSSYFGYTRYELFLRCRNLSNDLMAKFREYAKQKSCVSYFGRYVGAWDVELTLNIKTSLELRDFINDLKQEFGGVIRSIVTLTLFNTYNYVYFPEELR